MAKRRKKTRTHLKGPNNSANTATNAPKSFVVRAGKVGRSAAALVADVRKTMEPNTASRLRERLSNRLRDFVAMAGPLGVTHLLLLSQPDKATSQAHLNLRIARAPRGPTCTFRVNKFALARDVAAAQKRPRAPGGEFGTPPLLVLNNFGSQEKHVKLLVTVFQGLFPPIQVQSMPLSQARRIVLLSYDSATGTIDWRHYLITVRPVGVTRRVRRVIEGAHSGARGRVPNLADAADISAYVLGRTSGGDGFETDASSASEAESDVEGVPSNQVELPASYVGRGNVGGEKRAVRLRELGPRMELRCIKIQEGIPGAGKKGEAPGEVLWHDYVKKTRAEVNEMSRAAASRNKVKAERRSEQEANVERKAAEAAARKTGGKRGKRDEPQPGDEADSEEGDEALDAIESDEEDEFAYEDRIAGGGEPGDGDLFDDEGAAEDEDEDLSIGGSEDEDEDEDDSDLSPIEVTGQDYDESDSDDAQEAPRKMPRDGSAARGRGRGGFRGRGGIARAHVGRGDRPGSGRGGAGARGGRR
ncbi:Brix-domain-containing protein [Tilletiopsis washingtonensis]|uniref:Brix-domain-containing protein n=1 Tax=Tilletiopsis washingtonensis TaxID=58919 RepID=A0A316Z4E5_9BASI|nr:Brix-domain-containing protein [Tilletiopsis washingtonensis]PWN96431.1 Brix-domain-containing protein [Tilletiopsis washingtonensis]